MVFLVFFFFFLTEQKLYLRYITKDHYIKIVKISFFFTMVMWPHSIRQHMPPQRILYKKRMGFGPSSFKSQNNPKFIQSHGLGFC